MKTKLLTSVLLFASVSLFGAAATSGNPPTSPPTTPPTLPKGPEKKCDDKKKVSPKAPEKKCDDSKRPFKK
jgi:hypothetical protein